MIKAEVYSKGEIVAQNFVFEDSARYVRNPSKDPFFVVLAAQENIVSIESTDIFREWYIGNDTFTCPNNTVGVPAKSVVEDFNLPIGTFVSGSGVTDDGYVVTFGVHSQTQIEELTGLLEMRDPLVPSLWNKLEEEPQSIARFINNDQSCYIEGILYFDKDKQCTDLQVRFYYQDLIGWETNFLVNIYSDGSINGVGKELYRRDEYKYILDTESHEVEYVRHEDGDLLIRWKGLWKNKKTGIVEEEIFTSSSWWFSLVGYRFDDCFKGYDLAPEVNYWVCKSERNQVSKLMFYVQSSEMLEKVADYYGVKIPCSKDVLERLDSTPTSFRVRHYDLFDLGPGKWVPLVMGAVVIDNGVPTILELYERKRWNEG